MASRKPAEVFHPGEFVIEELEARGWSPAHLAEAIGCPSVTVDRLLQGTHDVTPEIAAGLVFAFGGYAEYWINLDAAYRRSHTTDTPDTGANSHQSGSVTGARS